MNDIIKLLDFNTGPLAVGRLSLSGLRALARSNFPALQAFGQQICVDPRDGQARNCIQTNYWSTIRNLLLYRPAKDNGEAGRLHYILYSTERSLAASNE